MMLKRHFTSRFILLCCCGLVLLLLCCSIATSVATEAEPEAVTTAEPASARVAEELTDEHLEKDLIKKMKKKQAPDTAPKKQAPIGFQSTTVDSYESKKEELQCRACVGIADLFFNIYIPKVREVYQEYLGTSQNGEEAERKKDAAVPKPFPRGMRERLAADIYTNVDDLCVTLKKVYKRQEEKEEQARKKAGDSDGSDAAPPMSSSANRTILRRNIVAYCPGVFEGVEDRLLKEAFQYFPTLRAKGLQEVEEAASQKKKNKEAEEEEYKLPPLGRFCEEMTFCIPYIHYYITNDIEDGGLLNVDDGRREKEFAKYNGTKKKYSNVSTPEEVAQEKVPSIMEAVLTKEVWLNLLREGDVFSEALTFAFWKQLFQFLFLDDNMHFHLGPTFKKATAYFSAAMVALVVVVYLSVRLCCPVRREHGEDLHKKNK